MAAVSTIPKSFSEISQFICDRYGPHTIVRDSDSLSFGSILSIFHQDKEYSPKAVVYRLSERLGYLVDAGQVGGLCDVLRRELNTIRRRLGCQYFDKVWSKFCEFLDKVCSLVRARTVLPTDINQKMNRLLNAQMAHTSKARADTIFCKYSHRKCMQTAIEGYDFCLRHILEDKSSPFKQCSYLAKSGRRCPIAALKQERKDGLCMEHAKKATLSRQRMNRKKKPRESADVLLEDLASSTSGMNEMVSGEHRRGKSHTDSIASKALEYASSSDSESEQSMVSQVWQDNCDSDAESIDSDQEDILKYAGVYTTEEVAQILRDKLIRLQALYLDQFKRLRHVLLTKRRQYLISNPQERETLGSVKLYKKDPRQRLKYDRLCAMKRYHRKFGKEALLQKHCTDRRMKATEGPHYQPVVFPRCEFYDEGVPCAARVVPLSKYCQKHILHDPSQVLYRPCPFADSQCGRPVPCLYNSPFCSLHQRMDTAKEPEQASPDIKPEPMEAEIKVEDIKFEPLANLDPSQQVLGSLQLGNEMEIDQEYLATSLCGKLESQGEASTRSPTIESDLFHLEEVEMAR